jgi:hypothetical protein
MGTPTPATTFRIRDALLAPGTRVLGTAWAGSDVGAVDGASRDAPSGSVVVGVVVGDRLDGAVVIGVSVDVPGSSSRTALAITTPQAANPSAATATFAILLRARRRRASRRTRVCAVALVSTSIDSPTRRTSS